MSLLVKHRRQCDYCTRTLNVKESDGEWMCTLHRLDPEVR